MPYVISFVAQKGGVGKSTLARAVAQEIKKNGMTVKLADLDVQQGTSQEWHRRRLEHALNPVGSVEVYRSFKEAFDASDTFDALVIDGAGRTSEASLAIAQHSDLVVQPTGASLDDLVPAVRFFHELVGKGIPMNKLYIGLCRIGTPTEEETARDYFAQAGYAVLEGGIYERPAYRLALNSGKTITETGFGSLNEKADALIQAIFDKLQE